MFLVNKFMLIYGDWRREVMKYSLLKDKNMKQYMLPI